MEFTGKSKFLLFTLLIQLFGFSFELSFSDQVFFIHFFFFYFLDVEEQCIVLILEQTLSIVENAIFEKLLHEIGVKNSIPKFFSKIGFDEANRRLVAFTKHLEETPSCNSTPTDYAARNVNVYYCAFSWYIQAVHYHLVHRQFIKM